MAVDEQARHELYEAHKRQFGVEVATTLMELLPPVGWADVATKHDLLALEQRIDLRLEALELRLNARMQAQLRRQTVHLLAILVPSLVGTIAAAFSSTHFG